jgi:hypothetical protein
VTHPKEKEPVDKKMQKSPRKTKTLTKTPTGTFPLSMASMMPELPSLPGLPPLPSSTATTHTAEASSSESTSKESRESRDGRESKESRESKELKKPSAEKIKIAVDNDGEVEVSTGFLFFSVTSLIDFVYLVVFVFLTC